MLNSSIVMSKNNVENEIELESDFVIGTCMEMCPEAEIEMRERERLLHPFEILPCTKKDPFPKADKTRMVKSFSRSAAGKSRQDAKDLRPPDILLKTVNYLLDEIVSKNDIQWRVVYDFILDRLRSVRQDMIIQNTPTEHQIRILQPIVKFLAYSSYRLCETGIDEYDPYINNTHLQECLKRLLCMYDYYDGQGKSGDEVNNRYLYENRSYFEALYIVFNSGNPTALTRALNLSLRWRDALVQLAMEMSMSHLNSNFVRVCRIIEELPPLLASVAYLNLPGLRRNCLKIMSNAYSSKNLTFPVVVLQKILLFNNEDEVISDCNYYGLKVNESGVFFLKNDFDNKQPVVTRQRRSVLIDEKLNQLEISSLILFGE